MWCKRCITTYLHMAATFKVFAHLNIILMHVFTSSNVIVMTCGNCVFVFCFSRTIVKVVINVYIFHALHFCSFLLHWLSSSSVVSTLLPLRARCIYIVNNYIASDVVDIVSTNHPLSIFFLHKRCLLIITLVTWRGYILLLQHRWAQKGLKQLFSDCHYLWQLHTADTAKQQIIQIW